jgi:signal transduction histidine kinase
MTIRTRPWLQTLFPRPFEWVSTFLYVGVVLVHFYFSWAGICQWCASNWIFGLLLSATILALLTLDRIEYWCYGEQIKRRTAMLFLGARIALIVVASILDNFNLSMFLYVLVPFTAFPVFGSGWSYLLTFLAWLVYFFKIRQLDPGWTHDAHQVIFVIVYSFGLVFVVAMAHVVNKERESRTQTEKLLHALENSHQQLRDYAAQVAELATIEERNRLARDIHDSLGHYLTVINVQLEKALAFRDKKPSEAEQAVRDAKRIASEALQDTRRSVGTLRHVAEAFSLCQALQGLVQNLATEQLQVELSIEGDESEFSRQSLMTIYRAAQEGLTNVQKHAHANRATVQVTLRQTQGHLRLCDNGIGFDPASLTHQPLGHNERYGLQGVRERLELIGGALEVHSQIDEGTSLLVTVPKNPLLLNGRQN